MHSRTLIALSLAFVWCVVPRTVQAQAASNQDGADAAAAASAAAQMVPAEAVLAQQLDTKEMQPGAQFKAVLSGTVHLKNGVELPKGTTLVGTIASETAPAGAKAELALRFTQADLKSGKTIPIEAAIVGVAPPDDNLGDNSNYDAPPSPWNGTETQVDMIGVLSNVNLHSKLDGKNSGVFVSTKKSDMKLPERTQLALAIGAQETSGMNGGS